MFGLTTPSTNSLSQPSPAWIDTTVLETAAMMVAELKAQGCSVIICLSHLGLTLDQLLASYIPGIDVIVGGHDHYLVKQPVRVTNPSGESTLIVQANAFYQNIGKLRLAVTPTSVRVLDYELVTVDETIPIEPTVEGVVKTLIQSIEQTYGPLFTQQIAVAKDYLEEVAQDLVAFGKKDTPIGNLVTDAYREKFKTDISFEVGGSTAQPLYKGPIVAADLFRVVGYGFNEENGLGYRMATFKIKGADLLAGIEFGLSSIEENDEFLAQVSGMSYTYDPKAAPYSRLVNVKIGGNTLDPMKEYTVAANEFVPLFLSFLGIPCSDVKVQSALTEFQVLSEYVAGLGELTPHTEGRIQATTTTMVTRDDGMESVPMSFSLSQNYPNPFNPTTTIQFELPRASQVSLKVYSIIGQEVATLVESEMTVGRHQIEFNAQKLSSGVYFYRLNAAGKTFLRKMVLAK
ncbi:MAG: 5'-nucleotidase C-terminal domain-containing protein [bacterium]